MNQFTKGGIPVDDVQRSRDTLNEINRLESLTTVLIEEDSIDEFFQNKKIRKVPLFLETLKNYFTESEASISTANIKTYENLHFARESSGELVAYIHKSKKTKVKSPTEIMFDRYS
jgi:hypothetical protein